MTKNKIPFLSDAEIERLALLMEEMAEAQQVIGKILRHGYKNYHPDDPQENTNRMLLSTEMGHVWAATQMMVAQQDISGMALEWGRAEKHEKVKKWMHHQPASDKHQDTSSPTPPHQQC